LLSLLSPIPVFYTSDFLFSITSFSLFFALSLHDALPISGASRNEAYAEQARFQQLYRDIDTYISYEEPNYRVKVGDFRGRSEATRLMQSLRGQFNNVFIFTEDIFVYH